MQQIRQDNLLRFDYPTSLELEYEDIVNKPYKYVFKEFYLSRIEKIQKEIYGNAPKAII